MTRSPGDHGPQVRPGRETGVRPRTPHHLGGDRYVADVSVGRLDDDTVRDCPTCGGRLYEDRWHVRVEVTRTDGPAATHHLCGESCLRDWLRLCTR